jgi:hypothetical protein
MTGADRAGCYKDGMFRLFKPKLPVSLEDREWVDASFVRLANLLGAHRLHQAKVLVPTEEHFPDPFDGSEAALVRMFARVATAMGIDPDGVDVTVFQTDSFSGLMPFYSGKIAGPAGLYHHDPSTRPQISVNEKKLKDPVSLVATLAHELGHIVLLRPGLVGREETDMEPLNDLATVFLGLGVFTGNAAFQFRQFTENDKQGWSTERQGYLPEELFGYALARFALERGENKPSWARYLSTNVGTFFRESVAWLTEEDAHPHLVKREG